MISSESRLVFRGDKCEERLYLHNLTFCEGGKLISVRKTAMPDLDGIIARHKARYHLVAFFCRPGMKVLDFPCGSGYGSEVLDDTGIIYEGYDLDQATISYCNYLYKGSFFTGDLTAPALVPENYDVIACMEGLEHISKDFQRPLVKAFYHALKPNGTLIISCPEAQYGKSGPNDLNPFHLWELTLTDFNLLISEYFKNMTILSVNDTLHNGSKANCMYGICRKGG